jgi:hypothetical protein
MHEQEIPNLDEIASTGAGQDVQLLSVFQDMAPPLALVLRWHQNAIAEEDSRGSDSHMMR